MIAAVPPAPSRRVSILTQTESLLIVKARLACKYLRNSSLRVIFAYFIHERRVDFIELFFKGDKEREDGARINRYLREHQDNGSAQVWLDSRAQDRSHTPPAYGLTHHSLHLQ